MALIVTTSGDLQVVHTARQTPQHSVVTRHDEAILFVIEDAEGWSQAKADFARWLMEVPGLNIKALKQAEWESLAEMCGLPTIHIDEFPEWQKSYVDSDTRSEGPGCDDPGEEPRKGLPGLHKWWRMLRLPLRF